MTQETETLATWMGRPIEAMTREELIIALQQCAKQLLDGQRLLLQTHESYRSLKERRNAQA